MAASQVPMAASKDSEYQLTQLQFTKQGRTNRSNAGKISVDRSTKTTLTLTIPGFN